MKAWSSRYSYATGDDGPTQLGHHARERGWFTREDFLVIGEWKSPRVRKRREKNDESFVKAVTEVALGTENERMRIEILLMLEGVDWPTASVLLHFGHREKYPILDFRAVWALGAVKPSKYSFSFWSEYTIFCRLVADEAGVSMRDLDRALWAYSKENQRR